MRVVIVYDKLGKRQLRQPDGRLRGFAVFRWYHWKRHARGWEFHLLATCVATTEDFKFQAYQGLVGLGRNTADASPSNFYGFWLDISFDRWTRHLGGRYA